MENKQTAVDWLFDKITQNQEIRWRGTRHLELFKQAKQMEKEHIMMAYNDGRVNQGLKQNKSSEQYYNETYGN
jgi:hypothetical protein